MAREARQTEGVTRRARLTPSAIASLGTSPASGEDKWGPTLNISKIFQTAAVLLIASASGGIADSNPILGKWHLTGEQYNDNMPGVHCSFTGMIFTATTQNLFAGSKTGGATAVTYIVSGKKVYVVGDAGITNAVIYDFSDANHMAREEMLACSYTRG